jgi:tripartite-type tricarboxylate transporter receptor subunit TctC
MASMKRLGFAVAAALFASLPLFAEPSQAQTWPQRPVKLIIPFGPGAGADIGARLIQASLQARWGKPVIIVNQPGGDSIVAIQSFLSANDDHTFLWSPSGNFTVHPFLYQKLPYDPADIIPVVRFSNTILAVGVPAAMNIANLNEFIVRVRAEPGKFNGTAVPGITDFAFDYFAKTQALVIAKLPYRDTVQAATDLGEGRIQVYASSYAIMRPQTEAGRIKILAVMGHERAPNLPQIPSGVEEGYPALDMEGLVGMFGIKDMSSALREKIASDVIAVSRDPAIEAMLLTSAQVPNLGMPAEFAKAIERQRELIAAIAAAVGIKPNK